MIDVAKQPVLFSGSSHPSFALEIAKFLGLKVGEICLEKFPDGEIFLQILENVRGKEAYVVQSVALDPNNYLMELLIMVDALKRASASRIVAVIPYFGYCRQDRKDRPRVPITAKLVADMLEKAGVDQLLTMDLHAGQLQGFFNIPVDHLYAHSVLSEHCKRERNQDFVVLAPDIGSVKLARAYATDLNVDFAVIDKHRKTSCSVAVVNVIGNVEDKIVLLADDMCSTAETLVSAAKACQEKGAKKIFAVVTHGLFVGRAVEKIEKSSIERMWVSNTLPFADKIQDSTKITQISVAPLFGQAIHCMLSNESISSFCS